MKVIMLKDLKGIGKKGQTIEAKDGYASNFLIPRGYAVKLTERSQEVLDKQNLEAKLQFEAKQDSARVVAKKLDEIVLEFTANGGEEGRMFGSISTKQIEQMLKEKYNIIIDKRKFIDKTIVDRFGYTKLRIELFKGVEATVTVHVSNK